MVICLRMGKTYTAKPHQVILRSPLLRIHYYQNKQFTSKGILVPYTNLQLNPYPNTQLDLFCSDNLSFYCTSHSGWLTNSMHRSKYVTNHQLEKDVGYKVLQFITRWRSRNSLITKPYSVQTQWLLEEKDELGHMSLVKICLWKTLALSCINCDGP